MRNRIFIGVIVGVIAAIFAFKWINGSHKPVELKPVASAKINTPSTPDPMSVAKQKRTSPMAAPDVAAQPTLDPPEVLSADRLVDELTKIGRGPVTAEQAARFKADLKELIRRGAGSVPAIQKFLEQNANISYADVPGGDQLSYSSLRATMIDALDQIAGPEAQSAMLETLQTTAMPGELLQLANDLDALAPGKYHDQIVQGVQETLAMAAAGQLPSDTELEPAFHALQTYGKSNTTDDLANNNPLQFYAAVEWANMPDGQGLSSLIQMEKTSTGDSQVIATEMIAQMAGQNPDALDTLADMAQNGQIDQDVWVKLAPILAGDEYQMDSTGQNYTHTGDSGLTTPDQIQPRINMIDALLNFVPPDSAAAAALRQELAILNGKLN